MVEPESLPLSALQHWLFCPRQCALIHVERLWEENRLTAEGRVLHERADAGIPESREGMRVLRSVHVASDRLGVHGVALSLINRRQLAARDFEAQETGAVLLTEEARRTVLQAYHDRKRTELRHAWLDERMALGLVPQVQAQMLARHLRGDLDAYPAWIW